MERDTRSAAFDRHPGASGLRAEGRADSGNVPRAGSSAARSNQRPPVLVDRLAEHRVGDPKVVKRRTDRHGVSETRQCGQLSCGRLVSVTVRDPVASGAHDGPDVGSSLDQPLQDGGEGIDTFLDAVAKLDP